MQNVGEDEVKELRLILKADVQGSVEAVKQSLENLNTAKARVNVLHYSVGAISLNDVMLASASSAIIIGFGVKTEPKVHETAEAEGIDGYFATVSRMADELAWVSRPSNLREAVELPWHARTILRYGLTPLSHFLDGFTDDPYLRAVLSIQAGDHGMAPRRAPAALHAGLQSYYFDGGCYPRGGGHHIPDTLAQHIKRHGGHVVLRTEVTRVLVKNGRAIGVALADGTEVRSAVVVANTDPGMLWGRLVDERHLSAHHHAWRSLR